MGGGGGSQEVEETQYQKELAKVADAEWRRYQNVYVPLEGKYFASVEKMGSEQSYRDVAGDVNTAYQQQFSEAGEQQQKALAASGVDPSSGRAQAARQELGEQQAATASQAQSQGQHSATESYTGGLQNIVAMGKGQQTQAIQGLQDISMAAQQKATEEAQIKAQEASLPAQALGAVAGGVTASKSGREGLQNAWSNLTSGNIDTSGTTLDAANRNPFSQTA